jgi:hypothetical protein
MQAPEFFLILTVLAGGTWLLRPVVLAIAERLRGTRGADADTQRQIEILREDLLTELQVTRREMADLGERLDFAERLLAQHRAAQGLPPGERR